MSVYRSASVRELCLECQSPTGAQPACLRCDGPMCADHAAPGSAWHCVRCERSFLTSSWALRLQLENQQDSSIMRDLHMGDLRRRWILYWVPSAILITLGMMHPRPLFTMLSFVAHSIAWFGTHRERRRALPAARLEAMRRRFLAERNVRELPPSAAMAQLTLGQLLDAAAFRSPRPS